MFAHVTGLVLFEIAFWSGVLAVGVLLKEVAPKLDLHYPERGPRWWCPPSAWCSSLCTYRWKQQRMTEAADAELSRSLWPDARPRRAVWKFLVWRTALALLAIGMLDPKWGTRMEEMESEGVDIMIARRQPLHARGGRRQWPDWTSPSAASNAWSSNSMGTALASLSSPAKPMCKLR